MIARRDRDRDRGRAADDAVGQDLAAVAHLSAIPVPVLDRGGLIPDGDVEVGHGERVAVDGVELQLVQWQGALVGGAECGDGGNASPTVSPPGQAGS
jgi:hypothetical protein